jgi:site-specific DNA recombinase
MSHVVSSDTIQFIRPRRGGVLRVLIIARISTVNQDPRSLDDEIGLCKAFLAARYQGPVDFVIIQSQGSGEHLDTKELAQAEELIESGAIDLVIVEDLGRICRRTRAVDICEMAEDSNTRLIAINDHIDTAQGDWRLNAFFASFKHEMSNRDTAARIRRSLRERFKNGGDVQLTPYGYVKLPGAQTG